MGLMQWLAIVKLPEKRIRVPRPNKITFKTKAINVTVNSLVALTIMLSVLYIGGSSLIYTAKASWLTIFGEATIMLLLYDFMYYFLHRAAHKPKIMQKVHGVHHFIRHPTAFESNYVHPIEGIAGNFLFMFSLVLIGPISTTSFLVALFVFTNVNVLVHANIYIDHPLFKLLNYWSIRHDIHHGPNLNKNFASIFPFWDMMFNTYKYSTNPTTNLTINPTKPAEYNE